MAAKTLEQPKRQRPPAATPSAPGRGESKKPDTVTAFAIVKADIGQNLWQLATYTIKNGKVTRIDLSVEDLREILISKIPDLIGGFL